MGKSGKKTEVFVGFIVFVMICVIVYAGYAFLGRKYSAFSAQSLAALASDQYELGRKCYENKDYEGAYRLYYRANLN
jgi:hypothetical protein